MHSRAYERKDAGSGEERDNRGFFLLRYLIDGELPPRGIGDDILRGPIIVSAYSDFELDSKMMRRLARHYGRCSRGKESRRQVIFNQELGDRLREWWDKFLLDNPPTISPEEIAKRVLSSSRH